MRIVVLISLLLATFVLANGPPPRALHVGLHAGWAPTGAAAEAAAWIATTAGNATTWAFLDKLASDASPDQDGRAVAVHERVTATANALLPHRACVSLQWALASRSMSPRVSAHSALGAQTLGLFPDLNVSLDAFAVHINALGDTAMLLSTPDASLTYNLSGAEQLQLLAKSNPADHVLGAHCTDALHLPMFIVYADVSTNAFVKWHAYASALAAACDARYVLRHWRPAVDDDTPVGLQGYAVEVAVKSTEYRVVDDRVFSHRLFPDSPLGGSMPASVTAVDGVVDLDAFDVPFIGLAVAEQVRSAAENGGMPTAIAALRVIGEDPPVQLRTAADDFDASQSTVRAAGRLSDAIQSRFNAIDLIFVNGRPLAVSEAIAQSFPSTLQCLASVAHSAAALENIGSTRADVAKLLHKLGNDNDGIDLRVELVDKESEGIVTWYNDLTKDSRYKNWDEFVNSTEGIFKYAEKVRKKPEAQHSRDFQALVKVRANLLSIVMALDPGDPRQMGFLTLPEQIVRGDLPLRAGIILVPNDEVSTMVTAGFHYFRLGRGKKAAVSFISTMQTILEYMGGGYRDAPLSPSLVEIAFQQIVGRQGGSRNQDYPSVAAVMDGHEEVKGLLANARAWAESMGLFAAGDQAAMEGNEKGDGASEKDEKDAPPQGRTFSMVSAINGILLKDVVADALPVAVREQRRIAQILMAESADGELGKNPADWATHDPSLIVVKRVSKSLLSHGPASILSGSGSIAERLTLAQLEQHKDEWSSADYILPNSGEEEARRAQPTGAVTIWLASCRHSSAAYSKIRKVLEEFIKQPFAKRGNLRVGFLPESSQLSKEITKFVGNAERETDVRYVINGRILVASDIATTDDLEAEVATEYLSKASKFGANAGNGANAWDVALLASAAILDVDTACGSSSHGEDSPRNDALDTMLQLANDAGPASYIFPSNDEIVHATETQPLTVIAVSDPLGAFNAATTAFLTALSEAYSKDEIFTGLILVPSTGVREEVPKSRHVFTRFLLSPRPVFAPESGNLVTPRVTFDRLPQKRILTVDVKQPRPWFISSFATNYDMDNIILSALPSGVHALYAQYVLKSLLVEGSCVDERGRPPQGLQLEMWRRGLEPVDTLVMANLGYFQLRVPSPGQWGLSLAAGRSTEIFDIKSVDSRLSAIYGAAGAAAHTFSADTSGGIEVFVDSLNGACGTLLRVARKPGKEGETVLNPKKSMKDQGANIGRAKEALMKVGNLMTTMFDRMSAPGLPGKSSGKEEMIHVFSVASGHLYERFLKIMMLSVSKHASRPVKFWFLENYLSPSFKKMLPRFANMHGFKVGMVTYRWPGWLREQSEKQRIIWAYKILYLDVLFPLNVKRIIFVDADQVVRSDLGELMDIDLKGAPYGYVPFCDSRKEVEGYRFWKTGFWEQTLRGAKYHISALYVVDLQQLRETASGDKLRAMYQSLSADPNSLSNLDQDLPNYAAAVPGSTGGNVPIFGLPQDWLWCESWCDDESKKTAKTIDLCNNPKTKEPKLVSAKRIIEEWTSLDDEASNATEKIYAMLVHEQKHVSLASGEAAADVGHSESGKEEL